MRSTVRFIAVASFAAVLVFGLAVGQAAEKKATDQKQTTDQKKAPTAEKKQTTDKKPSTDQKHDPRQDRWRYTHHNGEWWYWLPTSHWVYWRDNRWNAYDAKTYTYPVFTGASAVWRGGLTVGGQQAVDEWDIRPFYGHAVSDLDRRPLQANEEIGPFYGRVLPNEFFGPWRAQGGDRPFYGHAVPTDSQ
jgi:hypothetical protein